MFKFAKDKTVLRTLMNKSVLPQTIQTTATPLPQLYSTHTRLFSSSGPNRGSKRSRFAKKSQSSDEEEAASVESTILEKQEVTGSQLPKYDLSSLSQEQMNELKALQKDVYSERVKDSKGTFEMLTQYKQYEGDQLEYQQQMHRQINQEQDDTLVGITNQFIQGVEVNYLQTREKQLEKNLRKLKEFQKKALALASDQARKEPYELLQQKIDQGLNRQQKIEESSEYLNELTKLHQLEFTSTGKQAQQLKSLISTMSQGNYTWDKKSIDRFVSKYISIVQDQSEVRLSSDQLQQIAKNLDKVDLSKEYSFEQFVLASENLNLQTLKEKSLNLQQLNKIHDKNPLFNDVMNAVRSTLASKKQLNVQEFKAINVMVDKYIDSLGQTPAQQKHDINELQKLETEQEVSAYFFNKSLEQELAQSDHAKYIQSVLGELGLNESARFKAFVSDLAVNTADLSGSSNIGDIRQYKVDPKEKGEASVDIKLADASQFERMRLQLPVLDRFINLMVTLKDPQAIAKSEYLKNHFLTELGLVYNLNSYEKAIAFKLIEDPEFMVKFQVVSLAKHHNFFGAIDKYMRQFAQICIDTGDRGVQKNLQNVLNQELSIKHGKKDDLIGDYKTYKNELDPLVLMQPEFQFRAVGDKMLTLRKYFDMMKEKDRTTEAINLLKRSTNGDGQSFSALTSSFNTLFELIEELDKDQSNQDLKISDMGTFEKLKKSSAYIDEKISQSFMMRFGFDGITFENMEQVYSPLVSGKGDMAQIRKHLIANGMTRNFADILAAKYIKSQEETQDHKIVRVMDIFDTRKDFNGIIKVLNNCRMSDISMNYQTLSSYQRQLYETQRASNLQTQLKNQFVTNTTARSQPVRPMARMFSTGEDDKAKKSMLDFVKGKIVGESEAAVSQVDDDLDDLEVGFERTDGSELHADEYKVEPESQETFNQDQMLIDEAISKYNIDFLKQFAQSSEQKTQKSLEDYIIAMNDTKDIELLLLSMINQAYELNQFIPNIELMIYKIFFSPLSTEEQRKESQDLLAGNIFADKQMKMHPLIYKNLLQTLTVRPKKKHFKKIVEYIQKNEQVECVSKQLLDQIINIGIDQKYPTTLGKIMRDLIIQGDYNIHQNSFVKFVMFMEKCKGYEEDAKKFLLLSTQSSHLQISYEMIRPFVIRIMKNKGGPELVKLFEQLRKNIKLNRSWDRREAGIKSAKTKELRKDFYDGLIYDLMENESYTLSEIVMAEKMKEKFDVTENDEIIGLNIYAAQTKFPEYREKFDIFMNEEQFEVSQRTMTILGETLMKFDTDEFKNDRLALTAQIQKKMKDKLITWEQTLFHNVCYVYTESQQWGDVAQLLRSQSSPDYCTPHYRTMTYLKSNLVYCFQNSVRMDVQDAIDNFEKVFFKQNYRQFQQQQQKAIENLKSDEIDEQDLQVEDKKSMRRQARQNIKQDE